MMNTTFFSTIINGIKAEYFKAKGTKLMLIALAVPVFMSICTFLIAKNISPIKTWQAHPWLSLTDIYISLLSFNIMLISIIGISSLAVQTENKATAWKHLLILPIPKWTVYVCKYLFILLLIALIHVLMVITILLNGWLLGMVRPELGFNGASPDLYMITGNMSKVFLSVLCVTALQYWFSLRVKNYMIPIFIGGFAVMIFTFSAMLGWAKSAYIPYSFVVLTDSFNDGKINEPVYWGLPRFLWFSIIGFVFISILAILDGVYKRIKE
jgi:lantibiotic transport system permease protein